MTFKKKMNKCPTLTASSESIYSQQMKGIEMTHELIKTGY